jgi:hypothetical protein
LYANVSKKILDIKDEYKYLSQMKFFIVFASIHYVIKAEKLLQKLNFKFTIVPIPREISSDCGMCILLERDLDAIVEILRQNDINTKIHEFSE